MYSPPPLTLWMFFLLELCVLWETPSLCAQVPQVRIANIAVEGNKRTKVSLIYGELDFKVGDTLSLTDLQPTLDRNQRYLINTLLFRSVALNIAQWEGDSVDIKIVVRESWYFFPLPQFELADRNFNVWWGRHQRDLRRTNIGLWLYWRNLSGYNDLFKAIVQFGYTRKFELDYTLPPLGRRRKLGFNINALYSDNKEVAYATANHQLVFYNNYNIPERQYRRIRGRIEGFYRPTLFQWHRLSFYYLDLRISPEALAFNLNFFQELSLTQRSFNVQYTYRLDRRDIQAYPLKGYALSTYALKRGLGIFDDLNQWELWLSAAYHHPLGKRWSLGIRGQGQYRYAPQRPNYYNNRAMGFNDRYVRGYQYYVIDGQSYALGQVDVNFRLWKYQIPMLKKSPSPYLRTLPVRLHLRYHVDYGYVWNAYATATDIGANTHLLSTGLGLDLILYAYNIIFQLEFTVNRSGEKGLYLRYRFNF